MASVSYGIVKSALIDQHQDIVWHTSTKLKDKLSKGKHGFKCDFSYLSITNKATASCLVS